MGELFDMFDADQNGRLNVTEIVKICGSCGSPICDTIFRKSRKLSINFEQWKKSRFARSVTNSYNERIKFKYIVADPKETAFVMVKDPLSNLMADLRYIRFFKQKWICFNDNRNYSSPDIDKISFAVSKYYKDTFPHPSSFENLD